MNCVWDTYLNILPVRMRQSVNKYALTAQETRLRIGQKPEIHTQDGSVWLQEVVNNDDLSFVINTASRYSPWSSETIASGYITASGGHRVGICGQAVSAGGSMQGIRSVSSVCIRVARDFQGIASRASLLNGSILILGRPGSGKTTLMRDLIRTLSKHSTISVVDEREEIFPKQNGRLCFPAGDRVDIMSGCNKADGIQALLRTMNPDYIAVDEITAKSDCDALLHAGWCGVKLLATAHAESIIDLCNRPVYKPLVECGIFQHLLVLQPDKTWKVERMTRCC